MKTVLVLTSFAVALCHGMRDFSDKEKALGATQDPVKRVNVNEGAADAFVVSLLPFKILLEYQLRIQEQSEHISPDGTLQPKDETREGSSEENLKSLPAVAKKGNDAHAFCTNLKLMTNLTLSEISNVLVKDKNPKENSLSSKQLEEVYNSLKECFFLKARNSRLWGPLWHCLNRLFLFFVFN